MPYYKKMIGEKCYLSPCSLEDAEKWAEWDNDLAVTIPLGDEAYTPYSLEKMREIVGDVARQQSHVFSIVDLETEQPIGRCLLFDINQVDRRAKLGIVVGEKEYWDRGYGQEATRLLLDYGFNLLNLNNIMLGTFSFNERAIACYRKVGFQEIGRRRQARIIAGKRFDLVLMDMLAEEFESPYVDKFVS
jgi:RimJ/RimL family protein N-acetyltransferase